MVLPTEKSPGCPGSLSYLRQKRESNPMPIKLAAPQKHYYCSRPTLSSPVPHEDFSSQAVSSSPECQRQGLKLAEPLGKQITVFPGKPVLVRSRLKAQEVRAGVGGVGGTTVSLGTSFWKEAPSQLSIAAALVVPPTGCHLQ